MIEREGKKELELVESASPFEEKVKSIVIKSQKDFEIANDILSKIKATRKNIVDYWKDIKANAKKIHSDICAKENELLEKTDGPQGIIESKMKIWVLSEKNRIAEENRIAQEEAEKLRVKEEARIDKKIAKAEEAGDINKIMELEEKKETIISATSPEFQSFGKTVSSSNGSTSIKGKKKIEITDKEKFVNAILLANKSAGIEMITITQSKLEAYIKANNLNEFPGLSITEDVSFMTRSRR